MPDERVDREAVARAFLGQRLEGNGDRGGGAVTADDDHLARGETGGADPIVAFGETLEPAAEPFGLDLDGSPAAGYLPGARHPRSHPPPGHNTEGSDQGWAVRPVIASSIPEA